jgi:MFS family permease
VSSELYAGPFAALKYTRFRRFILSRLLTTFGSQMTYTVLGWVIYDATHDPLSLGLAGLAEIIPFLSVVWFAGPMADRYNRRNLALIAVSVIFLSVLVAGLFLSQTRPDNTSAVVSICYGLIVMIGFGRGFYGPSSQAMVPGLVPSHVFTNATTWNTSVFHISSVAGPALGGLILGFSGKEVVWGFILVILLLSFLLLASLDYSNPVKNTIREAFFTQIKAGVKFVFREPVIIGSLSLDLFAVLFGGAVAMLPVFARDILVCGPEGLGLLRAAPAAGALLMAGLLVLMPPGRSAGKILFFSVAGFGLCMTAFAFSTSFWLSAGILFLSGAFDNVSVVIRQTVVQMKTPEEMRGRVAAVNSVFISLSNEIGAFESGLAAQWFGLVPSVAAGGFITVAVVILLALRTPELRKLDLTRFK